MNARSSQIPVERRTAGTQGRPGCELTHFDDLETLVEDGTFTLLVPEVVKLEVQKLFESLPAKLEKSCDELSAAIAKAARSSWNEIDSLKTSVLEVIRELKEKRTEACSELCP